MSDFELRNDDNVFVGDTRFVGSSAPFTAARHVFRVAQVVPTFDYAYKARAAMLEIYRWASTKEVKDGDVTVISRKLNSSWDSYYNLNNNDWFVMRFSNPTSSSLGKFDILVQATDDYDFDADPSGARGLFVSMANHSSGAAWQGSASAKGSPLWKTGSYIFPYNPNQLAMVGSFVGEPSTPCRIHVVGSADYVALAADTEDQHLEYDAGLVVGNYIGSSVRNSPPLLLNTGVFNRTAPGHAYDPDVVSGWRMTANVLATDAEPDVFGANHGTPAGSIILGGGKELYELTSQTGTMHDWDGASPAIRIPYDGSWWLGVGGAGFTYAWWCSLNTGAAVRNLISLSGNAASNNGPIIAATNGVDNTLIFDWGTAWHSGALSAGQITSNLTQIVLAVASIGGTTRLYVNGQEVANTQRTGNPSYWVDRNLTIGALTRDADPTFVREPWDGMIADCVIYEGMKSAEWVYRNYQRRIMWSDEMLLADDQAGILGWRP